MFAISEALEMAIKERIQSSGVELGIRSMAQSDCPCKGSCGPQIPACGSCAYQT